jgi:hypothetical protein
VRGWTRAHLPELLLVAGVCLVLATVYAVVRHERRRSLPSTLSQPTLSRPTPTRSRPTPPPAPPPRTLAIQGVSVSAGSFSATVSWQTSLPARSFLAYGVAALGPTLWTPASLGTEHSATVQGLTPTTAMHLWITASRNGVPSTSWEGDVQAPTVADSPQAAIVGRAIELDGQPFFPVMEWGQCAQFYETALQVGINLFMENTCGSVDDMLSTLGGRALAAVPAAQPSSPGAGVIGWYYPDEADVQPSPPAPPSEPAPGRVSFLTLSNHVYSGAAPPVAGRGIYPRLAAQVDVLGLDLYPLQGFCSAGMLDAVYDVQRQLVALTGGRPTYQWIESGAMNCAPAELQPTPATVRAETWLAIAGGASGIGFFPGGWTALMQDGISQVTEKIHALSPALLAPERPASARPEGSLQVSARVLDGALYVVAVNPGWSAVDARISVPGAGGRTLGVLGEARTLTARRGAFRDRFGPLAVHLYVAAPSWAAA